MAEPQPIPKWGPGAPRPEGARPGRWDLDRRWQWIWREDTPEPSTLRHVEALEDIARSLRKLAYPDQWLTEETR